MDDAEAGLTALLDSSDPFASLTRSSPLVSGSTGKNPAVSFLDEGRGGGFVGGGHSV